MMLAESALGPSYSLFGLVSLPGFVWHIINLAVFVAIIYFAAKGGAMAAARAKRERIAKEINEAEQVRKEMRAKFEDYDARMKEIDTRMGSILEDARNEATKEKARLIEEAKLAAGRIRDEAKIIADQEIARARIELQAEQIARASELAETILKTSLNKEDQTRLGGEFLKAIEGDHKGRPA